MGNERKHTMYIVYVGIVYIHLVLHNFVHYLSSKHLGERSLFTLNIHNKISIKDFFSTLCSRCYAISCWSWRMNKIARALKIFLVFVEIRA